MVFKKQVYVLYFFVIIISVVTTEKKLEQYFVKNQNSEQSLDAIVVQIFQQLLKDKQDNLAKFFKQAYNDIISGKLNSLEQLLGNFQQYLQQQNQIPNQSDKKEQQILPNEKIFGNNQNIIQVKQNKVNKVQLTKKQLFKKYSQKIKKLKQQIAIVAQENYNDRQMIKQLKSEVARIKEVKNKSNFKQLPNKQQMSLENGKGSFNILEFVNNWRDEIFCIIILILLINLIIICYSMQFRRILVSKKQTLKKQINKKQNMSSNIKIDNVKTNQKP